MRSVSLLLGLAAAPALAYGGASSGVVAGVVVDATGAPRAGLAVALHPDPNPHGMPCAAARTGADGGFRLAVPAGCVGPEPAYAFIKLYEPRAEGGAPHLLGYQLEPVRLAGAALGFARYRVPRPGWPDWSRCATRLDAAGTAAVRGRVADAGGRALAGLRIWARPDPDSGRRIGWTESDARGRFALALPADACRENLLRYPATAYLRVEPPPGGRFASAPAELAVAIDGPEAERWVDWPLPALLPAQELCVSVSVGGRPLPEGFVDLVPEPDAAGPGARVSLVPVRGGRACAPAAPGRYRALVSAPALGPPNDPLPAALAEAGAAPGGDAVIEIATAAPAGRPARIAGRVRRPPESAGAPTLLLAQTLDDLADRYSPPRLLWLPAGTAAGFSLAVDHGRLFRLRALDPALAARSLRVASADPAGGLGSRVELVLDPAARVAGELRLPDGSPFGPRRDAETQFDTTLAVKAASFWEDPVTTDGAYAGADGRFELTLAAPGFYRLIAAPAGDGFAWAIPRLPGVWVVPGRTLETAVALAPAARVSVERSASDPPPFAGREPRGERLFRNPAPRERWVVGLTRGRADAASALLFSEDADFSFIQTRDGDWRARVPYERPARILPAVPAARYDVYSVELARLPTGPVVRVLSRREGVELPAGRTTRLSFEPGDARPFSARVAPRGAAGSPRGDAGAASAAVVIGPAAAPEAEELRAARGVAELHALLAPRVELRGEDGRLAAVAFAPLESEDFGAAIDAAARGETLRRPAAPRELRLPELPPGPYRVLARAHGRPELARDLALRAGETSRLRLVWEDEPRDALARRLEARLRGLLDPIERGLPVAPVARRRAACLDSVSFAGLLASDPALERAGLPFPVLRSWWSAANRDELCRGDRAPCQAHGLARDGARAPFAAPSACTEMDKFRYVAAAHSGAGEAEACRRVFDDGGIHSAELAALPGEELAAACRLLSRAVRDGDLSLCESPFAALFNERQDGDRALAREECLATLAFVRGGAACAALAGDAEHDLERRICLSLAATRAAAAAKDPGRCGADALCRAALRDPAACGSEARAAAKREALREFCAFRARRDFEAERNLLRARIRAAERELAELDAAQPAIADARGRLAELARALDAAAEGD